MNADGSNPIRLTDSPPGTNFEPNWSPDGTKIVFTSTRDPASPPGSNYEVYVMDANGSNQTNLTNYPAPDSRPDWQRIAPPPSPTPTPSPTPPPAQALNLSTRLRVETGDRVLIGGFIITRRPSATSSSAARTKWPAPERGDTRDWSIPGPVRHPRCPGRSHPRAPQQTRRSHFSKTTTGRTIRSKRRN